MKKRTWDQIVRNRMIQDRIRERVAAELPEDDEGDDFHPWVWDIIYDVFEDVLQAELAAAYEGS